METGIGRQKTKLESVKETADWLTKNNENQPQFIATIKGKIAGVENPIENLGLILAQRKVRLQEALMNLQDYSVVAANLRREIEAVEKKFDGLSALGVDWPILKKQLNELKVCIVNCVWRWLAVYNRICSRMDFSFAF